MVGTAAGGPVPVEVAPVATVASSATAIPSTAVAAATDLRRTTTHRGRVRSVVGMTARSVASRRPGGTYRVWIGLISILSATRTRALAGLPQV